MTASHSIIIKQYDADNGKFRANTWVQDCQERANTHLTKWNGVDAHHTNGLSEICIRDIQDNCRAMILHSQHKWSEPITANLCPYVFIYANNAYSSTPLLAQPQGLSPLQFFTGNKLQDNPNHWHPFGCPNYILNEALFSSQKINHKWKSRSKVGVYLG